MTGRTLVRTRLVHALVGAALMVSATAASVDGGSPPITGPTVVTGYRTETIDLEEQYHTIGTLDVPRGRWVVWAHLEAEPIRELAIGGTPEADCTLAGVQPGQPGGPAHRAIASWGEGRHEVSLNTTDRFETTGGAFRLRCRSGNGRVLHTRMLAIRVGELERVSLATGAVFTSGGHRAPHVVHGKRDDSVFLPPGDWVTVGRVELAPGRWWITATVGQSGHDPSGDGSGPVTCQLEAGPSTSPVVLDAAMTTDNGSYDLTIALDAASTIPTVGSASPVRLRCRNSSGPITAEHMRLTAMRLGRLTTLYPQEVSVGKGWPRMIERRRPGPISLVEPATIMTLPMPAGSWVLMGKVDIEGFEDDIGDGSIIYSSIDCGAPAGTTLGTRRVVMAPALGNLALLRSLTLRRETQLVLQCRHAFGTEGIEPFLVRRIELTLLRAGTLILDGL